MALEQLDWPRRTDRLTLRPMTLDDVDAVWAYRRVPGMDRWLGSAPATREELVDREFSPLRLDGEIAIVHEGVVVGDVMLRVRHGWSQTDVAEQAHTVEAEIGWILAAHLHGRGLATEAVRAVLELCFVDLGLRRVTAGCFADNEPSWRLMERVGMRREAHMVRASLHRDLGWVDELQYAILLDEWQATD